MFVILLSILFLFSNCNHSIKCSDDKQENQKNRLDLISDEIYKKKPALLKLLEHDNIEIDTILNKNIEELFIDFCPELNDSESFEKFAIIYWYNFKYHQIKCCFSSGTDIIPQDFLENDYSKSKNVEAKTLFLLLKKNNINKKVIRNGFTISSIKFPVSEKKLKKDGNTMVFIKMVDKMFDDAIRR